MNLFFWTLLIIFLITTVQAIRKVARGGKEMLKELDAKRVAATGELIPLLAARGLKTTLTKEQGDILIERGQQRAEISTFSAGSADVIWTDVNSRDVVATADVDVPYLSFIDEEDTGRLTRETTPPIEPERLAQITPHIASFEQRGIHELAIEPGELSIFVRRPDAAQVADTIVAVLDAGFQLQAAARTALAGWHPEPPEGSSAATIARSAADRAAAARSAGDVGSGGDAAEVPPSLKPTDHSGPFL
ncbi:MAG: hypothetical protein JWM25_1016 [Thermoleophilia bacterium]|nr:hypothetical protein [Thermoleophilia bacterium]